MLNSHYNILVFVFFSSLSFITAETIEQDEPGVKDDRECDLYSASKCLTTAQNILDCYFNPSINCSLLQFEPSDDSFSEICNSMTYTVDDCLMDLLGYGCNGTDLSGFYQQWMTPIRAVIKKLCNHNESILRNFTSLMGSTCGRGSFTNCLWHTEKKMDLIDLLSSEMTAETCTELDARLQFCLQLDDPHCKSIVDIILDLGKEFVDNAVCKDQPVIWVPLADDKEGKDSKELGDDRDCSQRLALECFSPMLRKWTSYLEDNDNSSNFTEVCSLADNAINTCGMDILGFGCEHTPEHHYYLDWHPYMTRLYEKICGKTEKDQHLKEKSCWLDFISSLRNSDLVGNLLNIITSEMTPIACGLIADTVDSFLSRLSYPQCDRILEIVDGQKNVLLESSSCLNEKFGLRSETKNSSSKTAQVSISVLAGVYIFYCFLRS